MLNMVEWSEIEEMEKAWSMRILNPAVALLLVGVLSAPAAWTQASPTPAIKVNVRLVTLDVVVTDKKGNPVTNLTKDDFQVYEDAQPQTIRSFEPPSLHTMPQAGD